MRTIRQGVCIVTRRNKFNAVRVEADGLTFDSKREHARYQELKLLERSKLISDLVVHPKFTLRCGDDMICNMIPDFEYIENGNWIIEDVKSEATITPSFRIKMKLFHANFPSAQFRIVGLNKKYPSVRRKRKL